MSFVKKVLIVGGGLGGLSAGIALRKAGIEVEIVDLQTEYSVYGVGIIQQANALRALDALGVADEAMKRGSPYGKVKMFTADAVQFAEIGMPPLGRFPMHNGISRKILHDILYEACIENGVEFRMGLSVAEIKNGEGEAAVTFTDGTTGVYDMVIASDGINSKVRKLIFGDHEPQYIGSSNWRYAFKRPVGMETGSIYYGKKTKVGIIPMTDDSIYMFIVSAEGDDNPIIPAAERIDRMKAHLAEFDVPVLKELAEQITDQKGIVYSPLKIMDMPLPWHKNRVVLLGDAAHATIPQLGSGAALAIEDAVVLGELLQTDNDIDSVFKKYTERRYSRCKMIVDVSITLGKWEQMEWKGIPLPEGTNVGAVIGKTLMALTEPI